MEREQPTLKDNKVFARSFVEQFGIGALHAQYPPSRLVEFAEQASNGILAIGTECREEIMRRSAGDITLDILGIYERIYNLYSHRTYAERSWKEIDWGSLEFETSLGSFDFSWEDIAKG